MTAPRTLTVGGQEFTLLPLTIHGLMVVGDRLQLVGRSFSSESLNALVDMVHQSVLRAHPDVDRNFFVQNIEMSMITPIAQLLVEVNGLTTAEPGASGEAPPAQ